MPTLALAGASGVQLVYMAAALLFILGIKRLAGVRTARSGNALAAAAMLLAVGATLVLLFGDVALWILGAGVGVGLAVLGSSPVLAGVAVACGVASLGILAWRWATWISVRTDRNGLWVRLSGVDGAFADAVAEGGYGVT